MGGQKQRRRKNNGARNRMPQTTRKMKNGYVKDIDQIVLQDLLEENAKKLNNQPIDEDKPGLGQFYCIPCARYLCSQIAFDQHLKSKQHKKRFKIVTTEEPYTIEESLRAGGMYVPPKKVYEEVKMEETAIEIA